MPTLRIIGPGRAGSSVSLALSRAGWHVLPALRRGDDLARAAEGTDLLVIATPDGAVADLAASVLPSPTTVVAHLAGSLGLDVLRSHRRRGALHPLVSLADASVGAERLRGAWFAVSGDPLMREVVAALDGHAIDVADEDRAAYHAAACIASNHLVALLGQVERVAASAGLPLEAYLDLVRGSIDNVALLGPAAALTGPVARGDWETVARHLAVLDASERPAYEAMAAAAARLAHTTPDDDVTVIDTVAGFRKALDAERAAGRTVGLVPTMGYLHDGHASLIRRAAAECDVVAVTVFVNPLQFAAAEDLGTYPCDLDGDLRLARASGASVVFAPPLEEMYPGPVLTSVHVAEVSDGMEGASRPTHFDGVATVVAKLFNASGLCRAYFGEKDWQQLQVVRRMVADLSFPVDVIGCPIVREADGLAMSSRNVYLSPDERAAATVLHRALLAGSDEITSARQVTADSVGNVMAGVVGTEPLVELDYVEVVETDAEHRLLIAAHVGRTRLIDNRGVAK